MSTTIRFPSSNLNTPNVIFLKVMLIVIIIITSVAVSVAIKIRRWLNKICTGYMNYLFNVYSIVVQGCVQLKFHGR